MYEDRFGDETPGDAMEEETYVEGHREMEVGGGIGKEYVGGKRINTDTPSLTQELEGIVDEALSEADEEEMQGYLTACPCPKCVGVINIEDDEDCDTRHARVISSYTCINHLPSCLCG